MRAQSLEKYREAVRLNPCPKCGAPPREPCTGKTGRERISNHRERFPDSKRRIDWNDFVLKDIEGYVVYVIIHPITKQIVYVGQTGNFKKRQMAHIKSGFRGAKYNPIRKWLFDLRQQGLTPEFKAVEHCDDEESSLEAETKWVYHYRRLGAELLNNWRIHKLPLS
jgi:GIY-YIG catalytic domain